MDNFNDKSLAAELFKRNILKHREAAGFTREKLARLTNIPLDQITQMEEGTQYDSAWSDYWEVLCSVFSIEWKDLFLAEGMTREDFDECLKYRFGSSDLPEVLLRLVQICEKERKLERLEKGLPDISSESLNPN